MRRTHPATLLALLLLGGCGGSFIDIGAGTKPPDGIVMAVISVRATTDGVDVDLELRNESQSPFLYATYSSGQPEFKEQSLTERGWVKSGVFLCGGAVEKVELRPGERVLMTAHVYAPNRLRRLRVGVAALDDEFIVWSPVVDPATLRGGPARRRQSAGAG